MFQRIQSVFKFENLPEEWIGLPEDFLYFSLITFGYVAVSENASYGLYFSNGALSGFNLYYQPTDITLNNPDSSLVGKKLKIGEDCLLLRMTPDFRGLTDLIAYYAEKLALCDTAINTSLINSKIPYFLFSSNKAGATTIKYMLDSANEGQPAVIANDVVKKQNPTEEEIIQQLKLFSKDEYITDLLLQNHNVLLNNFDAEIGIVSLPYEKKERLVAAEAEMRSNDALSRVKVWLNTLNSSLDLINEKYGTNITVTLNAQTQERGDTDVNEDDFTWNGGLS